MKTKKEIKKELNRISTPVREPTYGYKKLTEGWIDALRWVLDEKERDLK